MADDSNNQTKMEKKILSNEKNIERKNQKNEFSWTNPAEKIHKFPKIGLRKSQG